MISYAEENGRTEQAVWEWNDWFPLNVTISNENEVYEHENFHNTELQRDTSLLFYILLWSVLKTQ